MALLSSPVYLCSIFLFFFFFILPHSASSVDNPPRTLGEHCDDADGIGCEPGLQCTLLGGKRTCRAPFADHPDADRCLHVRCPVVFPDCASDSVPVLIQTAESLATVSAPTDDPKADAEEAADADNPKADDPDADAECCPAFVKCQCDPQKCLVPQCPEGTQSVLVRAGQPDTPGACCDRFECRQSELHCEHVRCPDWSDTLDLYASPDGQSAECPEDSFRPAPYVPAGGCCPIVPQCTCRAGQCEPARACGDSQRLVVTRRGRGQPGACCDRMECRNETEGAEADGAELCRHGNRTYAPGERWHSPQAQCQECTCGAGGVALCGHMECPRLAPGCAWVGLLPGDCCPTCLGCRDDAGTPYEPGAHWARDACTNCTCAEHRWQCQKFICKTECEHPRHVPDECCPVCEEPTVVKEPSAPGCPTLDKCPLRCELGLVQNRRSGCFECQCTNGTSELEAGEGAEAHSIQVPKCQPLTEQNCARLCAHGYLRDEHGCALCRCAHCPPLLVDGRCGKQCVHGYELNSLGCPICKCRPLPEGVAIPSSYSTTLPPLSDASASSASPEIEDGSGFMSSTAIADTDLRCSAASEERDVGEWWTQSECWQCFCQQGKEFCSLISCPTRSEVADQCPPDQWTRRTENQCCPSCVSSTSTPSPNSTSSSSIPPLHPSSILLPSPHFSLVCHSPGTGQLFVDGETWRLDGACVACTCRMGHVLCIWNDGNPCPAAPCEQPVLDPSVDACCPRCPLDTEETTTTTDPTTVTLAPEVRTVVGNASSDNSSSTCADPDNSGLHDPGTEWRRDVCHSCRCSADGQTQCFRERCDGAGNGECAAGRMLSLKGRCCPICSDALRPAGSTAPVTVCSYGATMYASGEQFRDGPCRNCTCMEGGTIRCVEIHCGCADAKRQEVENGTMGECCSACGDKDAQLPYPDPSSSSSDTVAVLYSSFEQGTEHRVLFIGDDDGTRGLRPFFQLHNLPWLLLLAALAALLAACTALALLAGWRCRWRGLGAQRKKRIGAPPADVAGRWFPSIGRHPKQSKRPADEEEGAGTTTSLLTIATKQ